MHTILKHYCIMRIIGDHQRSVCTIPPEYSNKPVCLNLSHKEYNKG